MKGNLTNKVDECGTLLTEFMPKHTGKKKQEATHGSQKRNNPTENFVIKDNQKRACKNGSSIHQHHIYRSFLPSPFVSLSSRHPRQGAEKVPKLTPVYCKTKHYSKN